MTYLLINANKSLLENHLLRFVNKLLERKYQSLEEISSNPDIHLVDGKDVNSIGIEDVKKLQNEMKFRPFDGKIQLAIILESEKLTIQAQNSFLKTLEESSDETIYILCVNNEKNLLQTIISRAKPLYSKGFTTLEPKSKTDVLDLTIVEQFQIVEQVAKEKEKSLELISQLESFFKQELELEIKNGKIEGPKKIKKDLELLSESRKRIEANCNKRLVLEALFVSLNT